MSSAAIRQARARRLGAKNIDSSPDRNSSQRPGKSSYRQRLRGTSWGRASDDPSAQNTSLQGSAPALISPTNGKPEMASSSNVPPEVVLGHDGDEISNVSPMAKSHASPFTNGGSPPRKQHPSFLMTPKLSTSPSHNPSNSNNNSNSRSGYVSDTHLAVPMVRRKNRLWSEEEGTPPEKDSEPAPTYRDLRKERLARSKQQPSSAPIPGPVPHTQQSSTISTMSSNKGSATSHSSASMTPRSTTPVSFQPIQSTARAQLSYPEPNVDAADRGGGVAPAPQVIPDDAPPDDTSPDDTPPDDTPPPTTKVSSRQLHTPQEDEDAPIIRMTDAIQAKSSKRPQDLSISQKGLWDAVQDLVQQQKSDSIATQRSLENKLQESTSQLQRLRSHNEDLQKELEETSNMILELKREAGDRQSDMESNDNRIKELKAQLQEMEDQSRAQDEEHDRAIQAIQRVLADVSLQKESEVERMKDEIEKLNAEKAKLEAKQESEKADMSELRARGQRAFQLERDMDDLKSLLAQAEKGHEEIASQLENKNGKIAILQQEVGKLKIAIKKGDDKQAMLQKVVEKQKRELNEYEDKIEEFEKEKKTWATRERQLKSENDSKDRNIRKLKKRISTKFTTGEQGSRAVGNNEEMEKLEKTLEEKESALENAKMLIASLESANGSMTVDLRSKLKDKEEEISTLNSENEDKKKRLDSLAVELRELQKVKSNVEEMAVIQRKYEKQNRVLAKKLESYVLELQSASAVHESLPGDPHNIDKIADVLCTSIMTIKMSLSALENAAIRPSQSADEADADGQSVVSDMQSVSSIGGPDPVLLGRHLDDIIQKDREATAQHLRGELEERSKEVAKLEASLLKEREEVEMMQMQNERLKTLHDEAEKKLRSEIQALRDQCHTNLEVLTVKEQELQVLRDSIAVNDDAGVGYISGDDSDDDEVDEGVTEASTRSGAQTPSQLTSALTSLLAQGGNTLEVTTGETVNLKSQLAKANQEKANAEKELQAERESLANAKMIISSLEKANKNMLEDLRSRLQESNTAISSLLDRSVDNENQSAELKAELEELKKQKQKEAEEHKKEVAKLKDDALVSALRLAAKDREIDDLRKGSGDGIGSAQGSPKPKNLPKAT